MLARLGRRIALLLSCTVLSMSVMAHELAPGGTLRAAINLGNPVLAGRDSASGELSGVSVDLARELARQLNLPLQLVPYTAAAQVVQAIKDGAVDLAFVAIDPLRGADIAYTPAYVIIEGAYLVRQDSPIQRNEEVDRPGVRVAVGKGSAYDLFLQRELQHATLVSAPNSQEVSNLFVTQQLDVAANVKQQLEADARRIPGLRLLEGRFMAINQAMGIPKAREAAIPTLRAFIEEMKASGFVAQALARHGIQGAAVAPLQ
jgi:polar amino acid transport system substrate-binding protein